MPQQFIVIIIAAAALLVIGGVSYFSNQAALSNIKAKPVGDGQHGKRNMYREHKPSNESLPTPRKNTLCVIPSTKVWPRNNPSAASIRTVAPTSYLVVLPPDMREYIRISGYAREIYEDYTDQVEPFGLDECFFGWM